MHISLFIVALFTLAKKIQKQPKGPLIVGGWIRKMWCVHTHTHTHTHWAISHKERK